MRTAKLGLVAALLLTLVPISASAQHYTDWTGFEMKAIGQLDGTGLAYYELQRDYTISLADYFYDDDKLPRQTDGEADFYREWAQEMPTCEWDFVHLEDGILTVKKGFRWDGPSYPWRDHSYHNYRSSMVHDALYSLMRMDYLEPDTGHFLDNLGCPNVHDDSDGEHNRRLADQMIYMIAREDGQPRLTWDGKGAQNDFDILRYGGACATHDDDKQEDWCYHVSELTAYAGDGQVDLVWEPADAAHRDPNYYDHFGRIYGYRVERNSEIIAWLNADVISYVDTDVENGTLYSYRIVPHPSNKNQYDWTFPEVAVPRDGPGNCVALDGIDDYIEADLVFNDVTGRDFTYEAWLYPEEQGDVAVIGLHSFYGENAHILYYDGSQQSFSFRSGPSTLVPAAVESPPGQWYHVALTIDRSDVAVLYIDGEEQATTTVKGLGTAGHLRLGGGPDKNAVATGPFFKGMLDEVRLWNCMRTQSELQADMNRPLRGDEPDLVGLWPFDESNDFLMWTGISTYPPSLIRQAFDATAWSNDRYLKGSIFLDQPFVRSCAMNVECAPESDFFVDIKPGSCPNPLNGNMRGNGVLPVAVLGGEDFDVRDIDPATVELAGVPALRTRYCDVSGPVDRTEDACACGEDGRDGFEDLKVKFRRREVIAAIRDGAAKCHDDDDDDCHGRDCGDRPEPTEVVLTLTAVLYDGTEVQGYDCVLFKGHHHGGDDDGDDEGEDGDDHRYGDAPVDRVVLHGNRPNPFNPQTEIEFSLPSEEHVTLEIFDLQGKRVKTLVDGTLGAGWHAVSWDARRHASGIYLYRLCAGDVVEQKRMVLLR